MEREENLMGTIVFEPADKSQQYMMLRDMNTDHTQEYAIEPGGIIENGEKRVHLSDLLTKENAAELREAQMQGRQTSFMLSAKELEHAKGLDLVNPEASAKAESMKDLKAQYQNLWDMVKKENSGELTEENLVNRLSAEQTYRTSKQEVMETFNVPQQTITKMESSVRQETKTKSAENQL